MVSQGKAGKNQADSHGNSRHSLHWLSFWSRWTGHQHDPASLLRWGIFVKVLFQLRLFVKYTLGVVVAVLCASVQSQWFLLWSV